MQEIFEANKSEKLHGLIVWIPMLDTDNLDESNRRETRFSDPRVKQIWDRDRIFGHLLSQTLQLMEPVAWDVYLVYLPDHSWDGELPPSPAFWMHQQDWEPTFFIDPPRLKEYIQVALERTA